MKIAAAITFRWCDFCIKSDKCRQEDCCIDYREQSGERRPSDIRRDAAKLLLGIEPSNRRP